MALKRVYLIKMSLYIYSAKNFLPMWDITNTSYIDITSSLCLMVLWGQTDKYPHRGRAFRPKGALIVLKCIYLIKRSFYIYSVRSFLLYSMWDITNTPHAKKSSINILITCLCNPSLSGWRTYSIQCGRQCYSVRGIFLWNCTFLEMIIFGLCFLFLFYNTTYLYKNFIFGFDYSNYLSLLFNYV